MGEDTFGMGDAGRNGRMTVHEWVKNEGQPRGIRSGDLLIVLLDRDDVTPVGWTRNGDGFAYRMADGHEPEHLVVESAVHPRSHAND